MSFPGDYSMDNYERVHGRDDQSFTVQQAYGKGKLLLFIHCNLFKIVGT